jgi:hypothetical protein
VILTARESNFDEFKSGGLHEKHVEISISWYITVCSTLKVNRCFGGSCPLRFQRLRINQAIKQHEAGSKQISVNFQWTIWCYIPEHRNIHYTIVLAVLFQNPQVCGQDSCLFHAGLLLALLFKHKHVFSKRRSTFSAVHGVISQNIKLFKNDKM